MKRGVKGFIVGITCALMTTNSLAYATPNVSNVEDSNTKQITQEVTVHTADEIENLVTSLDFISIDGIYDNPYSLKPDEAQVFVIAKTEQEYDAFNNLNELDKKKVLNNIIQANYGDYLGVENVYVDFVYNGYSYADVNIAYGAKAENLKLNVKDEGEKIVVLKQEIDEQLLANYEYYYDNEYKYPYSLTDEQIQKAINEGKKGIRYVSSIEKKQYTFKGSSKLSDELVIVTPYLYIMRCSAVAKYKHKVLTFEEAKDIYNSYDIYNYIDFEFCINSKTSTEHQNLQVYMEQGEKKMDSDSFIPIGLEEKGKYNSKTRKYETNIILEYSNMIADLSTLNRLDYNNRAMFEIVLNGRKNKFSIDFSSIK